MEKFVILPHPEKSGWFKVSDLEHLVELEFQAHKFNETQTVTDTGLLAADANRAAHVAGEMGAWLQENYSELLW